jgi:hypothetical protein
MMSNEEDSVKSTTYLCSYPELRFKKVMKNTSNHTESKPPIGRWLAGFLTITTVASVGVADVFNTTHLFNPDWHGHARFHIGMQFTTLVLTACLSLSVLRGEMNKLKRLVAVAAPLTFWPGLLVAWFIPGTDVYASEELRQLGVPINIILAVFFLVLSALSFNLLHKSIVTTHSSE